MKQEIFVGKRPGLKVALPFEKFLHFLVMSDFYEVSMLIYRQTAGFIRK